MKKIIIVIFILVIGFIFYQSTTSKGETTTTKDTAVTPKVSTTDNEHTPTIDTNWKSYKSPRFGYTIYYPPTWYANFWKEDDPSAITGAHTFTNYDTLQIEKFMDHGIVDWKKFVGEKIAIKFDFIVEKVGDSNQNDIIDKYFKNGTMQPKSDLAIGNLNTFQYNTGDTTSEQPLRSYIGFIPDGTVVYAHVNVKNQPNQVLLEDTNEWQELKTILSSFTYKK